MPAAVRPDRPAAADGRGVVIFDGLDELLDTSRRADVTARVERFCAEYPLAAVLVTSRQIGYDEARLDDRQFTTYRLGGFTDYTCGHMRRSGSRMMRVPVPETPRRSWPRAPACWTSGRTRCCWR